MFDFIFHNLSTIIVGIVVIAMILGVCIKMYLDKKRGKSACGGHCSGCPGSDLCHTNVADNDKNS
ncbi:MAG: FeoB-associated Cys-rich membrane protein [Lachnospiraceae bacterium]